MYNIYIDRYLGIKKRDRHKGIYVYVYIEFDLVYNVERKKKVCILQQKCNGAIYIIA